MPQYPPIPRSATEAQTEEGIRDMPSISAVLPAAILLTCVGSPLYAHDLGHGLSIGGILAGAGQCQELTEGAGERDACRGALPFQRISAFARQIATNCSQSWASPRGPA